MNIIHITKNIWQLSEFTNIIYKVNNIQYDIKYPAHKFCIKIGVFIIKTVLRKCLCVFTLNKNNSVTATRTTIIVLSHLKNREATQNQQSTPLTLCRKRKLRLSYHVIFENNSADFNM